MNQKISRHRKINRNRKIKSFWRSIRIEIAFVATRIFIPLMLIAAGCATAPPSRETPGVQFSLTRTELLTFLDAFFRSFEGGSSADMAPLLHPDIPFRTQLLDLVARTPAKFDKTKLYYRVVKQEPDPDGLAVSISWMKSWVDKRSQQFVTDKGEAMIVLAHSGEGISVRRIEGDSPLVFP